MTMKALLAATALFAISVCAQDTPPATSAKMRVFVQGNNATAVEIRRELQRATDKPNAKSKFCMVLATNPKGADATMSVDAVVNGRSGPMTNYASSAELTSSDGTFLWSNTVGDGSKFMDTMAGGSSGVSGSRLLMSAAKAVCKPKTSSLP